MIFPTDVEATVVVLTLKLAEVAFAAIVTELGTDAAGFALAKPIKAPPAGAAPVRLTMPVADCPPVTVDGVTLSVFKAAAPGGGGL